MDLTYQELEFLKYVLTEKYIKEIPPHGASDPIVYDHQLMIMNIILKLSGFSNT